MRYFITSFLLILSTHLTSQPCDPATSFQVLDINNVKAGLLNGGDMWWDLDSIRYEVPKGSAINSSGPGALWFGGIDQFGQLRIAAQMYRQFGTDYWPGPLDQIGETDYPTCQLWDRHWKVDLSEILQQQQNYQTYGSNIPLNSIPISIKAWPGKGNPHALGKNSVPFNVPTDKEYAPFIDINGDGIYDPVTGDFPAIRGDQAVWWIFNDKGDLHGETGGEAIGLEVHVMGYAYQKSGALDNTTFYNYTFYNRGPFDLDSVYIAKWVDNYLGSAGDEEVGYVEDRNMIVSINVDSIDAKYGADPPLLGIKFLDVPAHLGSTKPLRYLLAFNNDFSIIGNPELPEHYYNYMSGYLKDGTSFPYEYMAYYLPDTTGNLCKQGVPKDKRAIMSTGPISFLSGDIKTMDLAVIWTRCPDQYGCVADLSCLLIDADTIQSFYDNMPALGISEVRNNSLNLILSPNPAGNEAKLTVRNNGKLEVELTDITGKVIRSFETTDNEILISRENLSAGIYFLKATAGDKVGVKKLVFR